MLKFTLLLCCIGINFLIAQTPDHILEKYKLAWQDEFNGKHFDTTKWDYRAVGVKRGIGIVKKENVYLDGEGHLVIEATQRDTNYYIGQISTNKKVFFKYGYFECRVKLNKKVGPSTAFWLQSPTYSQFPDDVSKSGAEIDILEYRRKYRTNEVHHTVHWGGYKEQHEQKGKSPCYDGIDEGFHTFALEWTPKYYVFYVDGKKSWKTRKSISHTLQYIILSLEMNNWSGDPTQSVFPDKAIYDYVRVYEKRS